MAGDARTSDGAPGLARRSGALAGLFPASAATAARAVGDRQGADHPADHPAEIAAIAGASTGRREEFLAGRACAHAALRAIGLDDGTPLRRGPDREPLWPAGAVGAISHAAGTAAAVAARSRDAWGLGLDMEPLEPPLDSALERLVLTPAEQAASAAAGHPFAKIAFCVKECVYKCVFPPTRWPLEFHDVTVDLDLARGRHRAVVDDRFRVGGVSLPPLEGRFAIVGGLVLAGVWVDPIRGGGGPGRGTGR